MAIPGPSKPSNPERDRGLARQARHGPRWAEGIDHVVDRLLDREARNRMRRYGKAVAVLRAHLAPEVVNRIQPVDLKAGVLTVAVPDPVLLSELSQHHSAGLQEAMVKAGSGISKVRFVLRKRPR
jgi:hypothetical protein